MTGIPVITWTSIEVRIYWCTDGIPIIWIARMWHFFFMSWVFSITFRSIFTWLSFGYQTRTRACRLVFFSFWLLIIFSTILVVLWWRFRWIIFSFRIKFNFRCINIFTLRILWSVINEFDLIKILRLSKSNDIIDIDLNRILTQVL